MTIRNPYYRAVSRFMDWCEQRGINRLDAIRPIHVAAYVEQLPLSRPSVKQHLSAISRCFDWLVSGGTLESNPATSVQRPEHVVRVGRTPVLSDDQARTLLESISTERIAGLRDRTLIGAMLYTFGRVGAVIAMDVEDYRLTHHIVSVTLLRDGVLEIEQTCTEGDTATSTVLEGFTVSLDSIFS